MKLLSSIIDSTIDKVIQSVGNVLDEMFTSDEEKIKAETAIKRLDAELRLRLGQQALSYDAELTKRWLSDNEHIITRLVRPSIVIWSYLLFTVVMLADGNIGSFKVNAGYIPVLQAILITVTTAYFGSRGIEKVSRFISNNRGYNDLKNMSEELETKPLF